MISDAVAETDAVLALVVETGLAITPLGGAVQVVERT